MLIVQTSTYSPRYGTLGEFRGNLDFEIDLNGDDEKWNLIRNGPQ